MLYIFDMYNIGRAFRSADTVLRIAVAVCVAAVFSLLLSAKLAVRSWNFVHPDSAGLGLSDWLAVDLLIHLFNQPQ